MRIGDLYYSSIDLGESITAPPQLQNALGLPGQTEFNQCVLLHLAAAYEWKEQKCSKKVPNRTRVDSLATQLHLAEYQQASQCVSMIMKPHTQGEDEIWSQAQDVMTPNHDRQLRGLPLFLQQRLAHIKEMTLRIIDIDSSGPNSTINMHVFGPNTSNEISTDLTICAWEDHMRFLIPSAETTSEAWLT